MAATTTPTVRTYEAEISIRENDAAAVISIVKSLSASWAKGDADTLSRLYAEDATVALPGDTYLRGRRAIRDWMARAFEGKWRGTRVLGQPLEIKYVNDDIIVMFSQGGAYRPGETEVSADDAIRGMWVFARQGPGWTISAYENTPVRATIPLSGVGG
jgi:uncharacterized protein (TIGR02246 family)